MDDKQIIELFCAGDELAIKESEAKYGASIKRLSYGITGSAEDAKECLNDTLMSAWKSVAAVKPDSLGAYLHKTARNISLDMQRAKNAGRRKSLMQVAFEELEDCLPAENVCAQALEGKELSAAVDAWLASLEGDKRTIFIKRYFLMETGRQISRELGMNERTVATVLSRLRMSLKEYLTENGYYI